MNKGFLFFSLYTYFEHIKAKNKHFILTDFPLRFFLPFSCRLKKKTEFQFNYLEYQPWNYIPFFKVDLTQRKKRDFNQINQKLLEQKANCGNS